MGEAQKEKNTLHRGNPLSYVFINAGEMWKRIFPSLVWSGGGGDTGPFPPSLAPLMFLWSWAVAAQGQKIWNEMTGAHTQSIISAPNVCKQVTGVQIW